MSSEENYRTLSQKVMYGNLQSRNADLAHHRLILQPFEVENQGRILVLAVQKDAIRTQPGPYDGKFHSAELQKC